MDISRSNAFLREDVLPVLSLICLAKNSASDRQPSKSHVVSWLSARARIASLNEGQSFASPEKCSGLRTWERGPEPPNMAGLGRLPGRRCAWRRMWLGEEQDSPTEWGPPSFHLVKRQFPTGDVITYS